MPKLVPIQLQVEEIAFIPVLRILHTTPGIAKVDFDIDSLFPRKKLQPKRADARPEPIRALGDKTTLKELLLILMVPGPMGLAAFKQQAVERGFSANGVSGALTELRGAGLSESAGSGLHKLTEQAVKIMGSGPKQPTLMLPPPDDLPKKAGRPDITRIILRALKMAPDGRLTRLQLGEAVEFHGFAGRSIDNAIYRSRSEGWIKPKDDSGFYIVTAKGRQQATE